MVEVALISTPVTVANPMRGSFNSPEIISATSARIRSANRSVRCPGTLMETSQESRVKKPESKVESRKSRASAFPLPGF